jgi:hypothetical protein
LHFCRHPEEAQKMREGSRSIGPQRTLRVSGEGYLKAVAAVLEKSTG